uniref:DUF1793-domain-containing protein n=1 Tax=Mycena chlorophos TaxID=658473 RepID=A0ABQ0LTB7_MYCCL|nr:predicted protein [Mycena chlorophos]
MRLLSVAASVLSVASLAAGVAWEATPFNPSAIPLAVRSPFLSSWLGQGTNGNGVPLNGGWPSFWTGQTMAWTGLAYVDGKAYTWMGVPSVSGSSFSQATQKSVNITSTQSIFVLSAGGVDITATFLSPVEPTDLVKQSFPFSYLSVSAASNDGGSHSVSVYVDISGEWLSGSNIWTATWQTTQGAINTHQVQLKSQAEFEEISDVSQYGSIYWSTQKTSGTTIQTGQDVVVRGQFLNHGTLANTFNNNFREISNSWPVFAHAHNLGTVSSKPASALFTIGHVRDPAIEYIVQGNTLQDRSLYFWTEYPTVSAGITAFYADFEAATQRANAFDAKVEADANKISPDYAGIVALSIRQVFGAIEITTSKNAFGGYNKNDILVFMKEISSDGNVNTADVMMPAWPLFLYTNPTLGKYMLDVNFRYQATGLYPNKWSAHDIGANYPKATGHNDGLDEAQPVEECGNMLYMALSYAQKTGDNSDLKTYESLLDQWTQYLIEDSLIPANQISTDDFAGSLANQTNLAIKGIVGIGAMAEIHKLLGNTKQSANYTNIVKSYVPQFLNFATSKTGPHLTLAYNQDDTWGLTYNLFGDKLMKLNIFNESLYEMQTAWYASHFNQYGVPLDTRHTYTKSDWQLWTASWVTNTTVRDQFITAVKNFVSDGKFGEPFSDWYDTISGQQSGFQARPVVGGHLALLVLDE